MRFLLFLTLFLSTTVTSQTEITPNLDEKVSGSYGFNPKDPIKVGGGDMPVQVFEYMKHLKGPNGEAVLFEKIGNGGSYDDPDKSLTNMEKGKLYMYELHVDGEKKIYTVYFDQYRYEQPKVLKGFTWQQ